jgi:hypothetical protein
LIIGGRRYCGHQNSARLPALLGIALSGNPAVTTLDALAPYTGLQSVRCWDNPGLNDIGALEGKMALDFVFLANTAVTSLGTLMNGDFQNGFLVVRKNAALVGAAGKTACEEVAGIEHPDPNCPAVTNVVDRDFACEGQVLLILSVSPENAGSVLPFVGAYPVEPGGPCSLEAVQTRPGLVVVGCQCRNVQRRDHGGRPPLHGDSPRSARVGGVPVWALWARQPLDRDVSQGPRRRRRQT